jgi:hypothetical protein
MINMKDGPWPCIFGREIPVIIVKIKNTEKISLNQAEFYYLLRNFNYYLSNGTRI